MGEEAFTSTFIDGARDLLGVALIIGIARGIVVVMDNGMITHTILHSAESLVSGLSTTIFINVTYWLEVLLSFLVPSSSGLAVLTMPIMAPLADFAHVQRDLVVTAYQSASGIVNLVYSHLRRGHGRSGNRAGSLCPLSEMGRAAVADPDIAEYGGTEHRSDDVTSQMATRLIRQD
ncbi:Arginine/ornithine antiporter ArcD [Salmonella enterica subsp. enterica]|uniref:Arginine/ornithine antiporter ArcD n=1 Tax=Salmonella enterica I TaxID=59201 RepID=A0A3S4LNK5_SALET|nr:Arginine/ornithine antiporter ArcD [Salmonella enterica subsp. enterica]